MGLADWLGLGIVVALVAWGVSRLKGRGRSGAGNRPENFDEVVPRKRPERHALSLEESLQFLDEIAAQVEKRFSVQDKTRIFDIGKALHKIGMAYVHVIDFAVRTMRVDTPQVSQDQQKAKSR